jgi:hypothetical protein
MFWTILNQELSRVLYIWQAELSYVGFSEEKVFIIITKMGQNVTGKQQTGLNYSREINYACAKLTPSMLRVLLLIKLLSLILSGKNFKIEVNI